MTTNRTWMERASCNGSGLDFFRLRKPYVEKLKATCAGCPVKGECLEYALFPMSTQNAPNQVFGFWAGTTPDDRDEILKTHPKAVAERKNSKPDGRAAQRNAVQAAAQGTKK